MMALFGKIPVVALLVLSAASVIWGDFAAKSWSLNHKPLWYWLGMLGYIGSGVFFIPTLLRQGLVVGSIIWDLLGLLGFLFVGIVIFKEQLTLMQGIGAALGGIALVLLSLGK